MSCQRDLGADTQMLAFVKFRHAARTLGLAAGCLGLAACAGELSTLEPGGPIAARIADLWWVMLAGALVILFGVTGTALYSLKPERRGRALNYRRVLVGWGILFPVITLLSLMAFAFLRGEQSLARDRDGVLELAVRGEQWGWIVDHPGGLRTRGILHVRAGQPFHVRLSSADVIHSFWVPRLGGKMDAIPGKENVLILQADEPGLYRGVCAEYCGIGHVAMPIEVRAHGAEAYERMIQTAGTAGEGPILEQRRRPAGDAFPDLIDYVLRWVGLR